MQLLVCKGRSQALRLGTMVAGGQERYFTLLTMQRQQKCSQSSEQTNFQAKRNNLYSPDNNVCVHLPLCLHLHLLLFIGSPICSHKWGWANMGRCSKKLQYVHREDMLLIWDISVLLQLWYWQFSDCALLGAISAMWSHTLIRILTC